MHKALLLTLAGALAAASACSGCSSGGKTTGSGSAGGSAVVPVAPPSFTLFALAEVRGQLGPCGCTTDPLGDLARTAFVINEARAKGPVMVVDAGSLLYSKAEIADALVFGEQQKAELLVRAYRETLKVDAIGVGPADLSQGPSAIKPARHAVNLAATAGVPLEAPKVIDVGGTKVGLFGVVDRDVLPNLHAAVTDPIEAGKHAVASLQQQGATVIVGLVQATTKANAIRVAKAIGQIQFVVAGLGSQAPEPDAVSARAEEIAPGMFLLIPANRGQIVSKLDVRMRGPREPNSATMTDAVGPGAATAVTATIDTQVAALTAELAGFANDPNADQSFLATKQRELADLQAKKAALAASPWKVPATGSYFAFEQVKINKALGCDTAIQTATLDFHKAVGLANVEFDKKQPPAKIPKGAATYVGVEACADCHQEAVDFWQKTRHAQAWKTLEDRAQQFDLDCINCHVTGWGVPSGATVSNNDNLRNVQCETCHAAGSIHVAKGGEEKPLSIMEEPPKDMCALQCHTKEHSDTFEWTAYMRDIVGPGHGERFRKRLGDGPTGHELRSAGLQKAGKALGPGCTK